MGLDITIYSVESEQKSNCKTFIINDEVEIFEKYFGKKVIHTKINQYADFEALGITSDKFNPIAAYIEDCECFWQFEKIADKSKITIKESDVPLKEREDKIIYIEKIGYQRKGMNMDFYDNYNPPDDYFIFTKERLEFIYDNYVEEERKKHFKECILDKFEEGKTFVTFDW